MEEALDLTEVKDINFIPFCHPIYILIFSSLPGINSEIIYKGITQCYEKKLSNDTVSKDNLKQENSNVALNDLFIPCTVLLLFLFLFFCNCSADPKSIIGISSRLAHLLQWILVLLEPYLSLLLKFSVIVEKNVF